MYSIISEHLKPNVKEFYLLSDHVIYDRIDSHSLSKEKYTFTKMPSTVCEKMRINNYVICLQVINENCINFNFTRNNYIEYEIKWQNDIVKQIIMDVYQYPIIKNLYFSDLDEKYERGHRRIISYDDGIITTIKYIRGYKYFYLFHNYQGNDTRDLLFIDSQGKRNLIACNQTNDFELENHYLDFDLNPELIDLVKREVENILIDPLHYDFRKLYSRANEFNHHRTSEN